MLNRERSSIFDKSLYEIFAVGFFVIALNALAYEVKISPYLFFVLSTILQIFAFLRTYKKWGVATALIMLLCINWPGSWTNVFGSRTEVLQLPWFYMIGTFLGIYFISNTFLKPELRKKIVSLPTFWFAVVVVLLIVLSLNTTSIAESMKDILPILFYWGLITLAAIQSETLSHNQINGIWSVYIVVNLIVSAIIFLQAALYYLFDIQILKILITGAWNGGLQTGFWCLMEDGSSGTIMMGVAVIISAVQANQKRETKKYYTIFAWIIATALSLTARRAGIVACMASLVVYGVFDLLQKKSFKNLTYKHLPNAFMCLWMIFVLNLVRPMVKLKNLAEGNGRVEGYETAKQFVESEKFNVLVGTGMNDAAVAEKMWKEMIPHNFIIRWFLMGGLIFTLLGIIMLVYLLIKCWKKHLYMEMLLYFNCILGGCVVPDIFNARFFLVVCMLILLSEPLPDIKLEGVFKRLLFCRRIKPDGKGSR